MKLTRIQMMERQGEFPTLLRQLSYNNVIVNQMIEAYVHGTIATKEEAYCQMVTELAKTRDELISRMVDEAHIASSLSLLDGKPYANSTKPK